MKIDVIKLLNEIIADYKAHGAAETVEVIAARDAVSELIAAGNDAWGVIPVNTPQSDRLHMALAKVEGDL